VSTRRLVPAFRHFRRLLAQSDAGGTSDAQLLQRFVRRRDESAFELLVWRHGPMVHGVCRRVLHDAQDAVDAFQATLLILARKAGSIGTGCSLGSWLYKVAYRVALRARGSILRRARREKPVAELPAVIDPLPGADPARAELHQVLDEELNRLPEKFRAVVVLCYLEGWTNQEAARQLRCPVGTVKTRLAQARRRLGQRLARRGLAPMAAGVLTGGVTSAGAGPPPALVAATVRAAAGPVGAAGVSGPVACLMEGVLRAMMVTKLKLAAAVLAAGLAVAGLGTASYHALAGPPAAGEQSSAEPPAPPPTAAEVRVQRLKKQVSELTQELRQAEAEAARERAVPPRKTPVAVIFGDVPITRDELAEYLLARVSTSQLETYVNRRILEHACNKAGVVVTDADVEASLMAEWQKEDFSAKAFQTMLRERHKTLREWKEDVVRPQVMLKKLARQAVVTETDLRDEFAARYGEKMECEFLFWPRRPGQSLQARSHERRLAEEVAQRLRTGQTTFEEVARTLPQGIRSHTITLRRHGPQTVRPLEKAAFALNAGEVSPVLELDEQGLVILKCVRRIPADELARFEAVRESLKSAVEKQLHEQGEGRLFKQLQVQARAKYLWRPPTDEAPAGP
jgi:RNA polymerase sigma factor (sigma-70 family)